MTLVVHKIKKITHGKLFKRMILLLSNILQHGKEFVTKIAKKFIFMKKIQIEHLREEFTVRLQKMTPISFSN